MPHWQGKKWIEIGERKRIVKLTEERGRKGLPVPAWWVAVVRDHYETLKNAALKSGDKRSYRAYSTKQIVFSLMAQKAKPHLECERDPRFDRLRKDHSA